MPRFLKRGASVEARKYESGHEGEIADWVIANGGEVEITPVTGRRQELAILRFAGTKQYLRDGDWVIHDGPKRFHALPENDFARIYERVDSSDDDALDPTDGR